MSIPPAYLILKETSVLGTKSLLTQDTDMIPPHTRRGALRDRSRIMLRSLSAMGVRHPTSEPPTS